jgi:hypothetical protein
VQQRNKTLSLKLGFKRKMAISHKLMADDVIYIGSVYTAKKGQTDKRGVSQE